MAAPSVGALHPMSGPSCSFPPPSPRGVSSCQASSAVPGEGGAGAADPAGAGFAPGEPGAGGLAEWEAAWGDRLWRGDRLGRRLERVLPTGHAVLDRELPGGGWPVRALTEVLLSPLAGCEWRLLLPALRQLGGGGEPSGGGRAVPVRRPAIVMIEAPGEARRPCMAGLHRWDLEASQLVRVVPRTLQDALWAAEQALQCHEVGAVLAWLPQVRAPALRRLQAQAQRGRACVFVFRPEAAARESSPAPLRVQVAQRSPTSLSVRLLKRRGPWHEGEIELHVLPPGLARVMAPRLRQQLPTAQAPRGNAAPGSVPTPSVSGAMPLLSLSSSPPTPERTDAVLVRADRPLDLVD